MQEKTHATAPTPPETKLYFKVKVRDAGTLEADVPKSEKVVVIRIDGIAARAAGETCKRDDGTVWPCGAQARGGADPSHPHPRRHLHAAARRRGGRVRRAL